jgi:hypothetical protein
MIYPNTRFVRFIRKHSDTYTSVTRGHFLNNINNIDRLNRICTKCDNVTTCIGDEYHYIMECEHFSNFRNRFIVTN